VTCGAELPAPGALPPAPAGADLLFGERLAVAERFVATLADTGVSHGLIGPREVPRLWERHVLNCAVIEDSFPQDSRLIDVGSGAGLPGLCLAIARPDLEVVLVEPLLRRTTWLEATVADLGLTNVTVCRARAEEVVGTWAAPRVTARAVARLDKLARWCAPLLEPAGTLVAMKGASAQTELEEDRRALLKLGLTHAVVVEHETPALSEPVRTVELQFAAPKVTRSAHPRREGQRARRTKP
jgi:16S rRNA (guanine527-N7)-methyltransferase